MNDYLAALRKYIAENPPNYGRNAQTILEMLYCYYQECNNADSNAVKEAFEELYQHIHGMPLREIDRIVDAVCVLCTEHERSGFIDGVKVGILLDTEITRK